MSDGQNARKSFSAKNIVLGTVAGVCFLVAGYNFVHKLTVQESDEASTAKLGGADSRWTPDSQIVETDAGKRMLWAGGPATGPEGEWFDITDSPLDEDGYEYGIGKDSIPAVDAPVYAPIGDRKRLFHAGLNDETIVFGYEHNGEARAFPIRFLNRHELVNDTIGGKPVTVGW